MSDRSWKTVYDSVVGTSHSFLGSPCQDACRIEQLTNESESLLVACLADGAGSASHAHFGSEAACNAFIRVVERAYTSTEFPQCVDRETIIEWCREMRHIIEQRALELGVDTRQLACTFLGAIVGEKAAVFFQIGDGAMVMEKGNGYQVVFWPQSGEYANTTNFLTDDRFDAAVEWCYFEESVDEFAAFSDGLERLALNFSDRSVHAPFLIPMFEALRDSDSADEFFIPLRRFLDSPQVNDRTDDDKTLVIATRLSSHATDHELL